jgi:putative transposase
MRFTSSTLASLLKPLDRGLFKSKVEELEANRYVKSFPSWDHFTALVFAQLRGCTSLRDVEADWNANAHHHYHLGCGPLRRSTFSDANHRRPVELFMAMFHDLAGQCGGRLAKEGSEVLRIIDSTPIPLGALFSCGASNGRIKGLKMHTLYDPVNVRPLDASITTANINDVEEGRNFHIEPDTTYLFDKGYYSFDWWRQIAAIGSFFVTRPKANSKWRTLRRRHESDRLEGDGFTILKDSEVKLASKGDSKLPVPLRLITVKPEGAKRFTIITNDMTRPADGIAALYKGRWQIELLFRWLKQHLEIKHFLGTSLNAIKLQLVAALCAFLLLRIAAKRNAIKMPMLRFIGLAAQALFTRRPIVHINKPPPSNPAKPLRHANPNQLEFSNV